MYYLILQGAQAGPYSLEQVQSMLTSGQINAETLVWAEGQPDWKPVTTIFAATIGVPAQVAVKNRKAFLSGVGLTLVVVGAVILFFLVIVGSIIGYFAYCGVKLDTSSKAYVDEAVPAIVTNWSQDELVKRESSAFQRATDDEQLTKLFTAFSRLGALKSYDGSTGQASMNYEASTGKVLSAKYEANATFENGKADIHISLIQENGEWKILGFRIDSAAFLK